MMLTITNITITPRAAAELKREKALVDLSPNQVFSLAYMVNYASPDGRTVAGFQPGYFGTPGTASGRRTALAQLPDNMSFYFEPRFLWNAGARYIVDTIAGPLPLFSIEPAI